MRLTSEILREQIHDAWARVEDLKIQGKYSGALAEEFAIPDLERAYDRALKREKKEARKGWWGR